MEEHTGGPATARAFTPRLVRDHDDSPHEGDAWGKPKDPVVQAVSDSLADLFLGGSGPAGVTGGTTQPHASVRSASSLRSEASRSAGPRHPSGQQSSVELLVMGHLPVLGTAWLGQYALHVAQARGTPVALARLEPGTLSIELFGLDRDDPADRCELPESAVRMSASRGAHWLVKADELGESSLVESARVGTITVLTGVGEASIVAAYRTLKQIVQRLARADEQTERGERRRDGDGEGPELRLALLGATPERAREASGRVRSAATTFLGRSVGVVVCTERIGSTGSRVAYRGPFEGDAGTLIQLIDLAPQHRPEADADKPSRRDVPVGPRPAATLAATPAPAPAATRPPAPPTGDDDAWFLEPDRSAPAPGGHVDPEPQAIGNEAMGPISVASDVRPAVGAIEPVIESVSLAPRLGLSPLPLRCPRCPGVELAVDGAGGLHAVATDQTHESATSSAGQVGMSALLVAEAWINENLDLLRRAVPGLSAGPFTPHLVTRVPASVRDLLATRVRVHLLVSIGGQDTCVGLN